MWLWATLMMTVWVALIAGVVWAIARRPEQRPAHPTGRAEEILAERNNRGEISLDEYRERLDALR
jgi:uncharacterized membrane protein